MKLNVFAAALISAGFMASGFALTGAEIKAEKTRIEAAHKSAKAQCKALQGNAKDVCEKEADGAEKVAKAELKARDKPSDKTRYDAHVAKAESDYEVAKERCDDLTGNSKDVCQKDAKAAFVAAKEKSKVVKAIEKPGESTAEKAAHVSEAKKDASAEQREASYKAAKERCDALSGNAKDKCVSDAQRAFGQN